MIVVLATAWLALGPRLAMAQVTALGWDGQPHEKLIVGTIGIRRTDMLPQIDYQHDQFILPSLAEINIPGLSPQSPRSVLLYADELDDARGQAMNDRYYTTGLYSVGQGAGNFTAAGAEYTKLTFPTPVVNSLGPDLVMFSIGFIIGENIHGAGDFYFSFNGSDSFAVNQQPDTIFLPAIEPVLYYEYSGGIASPTELQDKTPQLAGSLGNAELVPQPQIHSFDLSAFNVPFGASISELYLQAQDEAIFYPTLFVGLPPLFIPEPSAAVLMSLGLFLHATRAVRGRLAERAHGRRRS